MGFTVELNRRLLLRLLKKYFVLVILFGVFLGGVSAYGSLKLKQRMYTSTGELVQNDNNTSIIASYQQFVESSNFKKLVANKIDTSKWKNVNKKNNYTILITNSSSSASNTPFFSMSVDSSNKEYSRYVNNIAMKVLITNIGKYLAGANISIVSDASIGATSSPYKKMIKPAIIGFVIGIIVMTLWVIYREIFLGKIRDKKFVNDIYQIDNFGNLDGLDDNH